MVGVVVSFRPPQRLWRLTKGAVVDSRNRSIVRSWFRVVLSLAVVAAAASARADPRDPSGVELGVGLGYSQGFGPIGASVPSVQGLTTAGGALQLDGGWRIDPRWLVGAYLEGTALAAGRDPGSEHATGLAAGLQGRFHLLPFAKTDPWVGVGFGWRGLWTPRGHERLGLHGLDLARLQVGVDQRVTGGFSIAPSVGVALSEFLSVKQVGSGSYAAIPSHKLNTLLFAGVSGRFDL
jgi:hypothetical protein